MQNQTLNIWDLENGSLVKSFTFNSKIMGIDVIPNQKKCVVGLENGYMKAIDSDFKIIDLRRPLNGK